MPYDNHTFIRNRAELGFALPLLSSYAAGETLVSRTPWENLDTPHVFDKKKTCPLSIMEKQSKIAIRVSGGRQVEVYADVLVIINYTVNLLCLLAAGRILGRVIPRWRLCAAALLGGLGSLIIFFPLPRWGWSVFQVFLTVLMTICAFGFGHGRRFLHAISAVLIASFLFAGLLFALYLFVAPAGMLFYQGVVYFDLSAFSLLLGIGVAYLVIQTVDRFLLGKREKQLTYRLTLWKEGRTLDLKAFADTGNRLKEPFSGAPVIVCDREVVERLWPPKEQQPFRIIPFDTVAGEGALKGYRPDKALLQGPEIYLETRDVYIAASPQPLSGEFQAIINPQLVERQGDFCVRG